MGRHGSKAPWRRQVAVLSVALALIAVACRSGGTATSGVQAPLPDDGPAQDGGSLIIGVTSEASGWNPTYDRWAQTGALVGSTVLEPLATSDKEGRAQPWLATSWDHNADFTSWTIHLREGVTFHDGTPFNADTVKANVDASITAPLSGFALNGFFQAVTVVDPFTVRLDLTAPSSAFPTSYLATQTSMQRSPTSIASDDGGSKHPVGTGPFRFEDWQRDRSFKAVKNQDYWRPGEPHLDRIEFRPIIDDTARLAALQSGDIDMMLTASAKDALRVEDAYTIVKDWTTEKSIIIVNTRATIGPAFNPMSNIHARKAVALATDRNFIASLIGEGLSTPTSPWASDSPWGLADDQNEYPDYDPDAARREIEEYKRDTGQSELAVAIAGRTDIASTVTMQALEAQWKEVGITTSVRTYDENALIQGMLGSAHQLILASLYSAPEPDEGRYYWERKNISEYGKLSINMFGFANDTTERLLIEGRQTDDPVKRKEIYSEFVKELNRNLTTVWLFATPFSLVANKNVHGLKRASETPFSNYEPKAWWGELWISH